jgi:hypothetical protein
MLSWIKPISIRRRWSRTGNKFFLRIFSGTSKTDGVDNLQCFQGLFLKPAGASAPPGIKRRG